MFTFNSANDTFGSSLSKGLGGLAGGLFYKNPADSAKPYLDKIPGTVAPYYNPYIKAGNRALPMLEDQYTGLINNPADLYNRLGEGYTQSPGYGYAMKQGRNAIDQAAAAGGMLGSPDHQRQAGQMAIDLSNADFQNYLNSVLGLYGTGLQGEEGINTRGYEAGREFGGIQAQNLMNQADLAYNSTANQNQNYADIFGSVLGALF